jgi:integrase/recombinase XerD
MKARRIPPTRGNVKDAPAVSPLYDGKGNRKHLTLVSGLRFCTRASRMSPEVYTFCLTLAYTGARISEVLALTPQRFDTAYHVVMLESLKKRRRGIFRAVPHTHSAYRGVGPYTRH